jgi:hypothetical protein
LVPTTRRAVRVFVAGPYDGGDVCENVRLAIHAGDVLMSRGYAVFIPHLSHFQHMLCPRPRADWINHDLEWLSVCDVVLRLPGESPGADNEVVAARQQGIRVVTSVEDIE